MREALDQYLKGLQLLTAPMWHAARCFLTNEQGGSLAQMRMSKELSSTCRCLSAVVVHVSTVILTNSKHGLLLPFVNMIMNPATLTVSLFN